MTARRGMILVQAERFFRQVQVLVLIILASALLPACARIQAGQSSDSGNINIDFSIEPAQPAVGPAQLVVTVTDAAGQAIDDATLDIEGNMTHAGMVPILARVSGGQNGHYVVPFEWTMGGDWTVTVEVTLPDGQTVARDFPVSVQN